MEETAQSMDIRFEMKLYDKSIESRYIPQAMATDIRNSIRDQPDVLIVTLPGDPRVQRALDIIKDKIPLFGINAIQPCNTKSISSGSLPPFIGAAYIEEQSLATLAGGQIRQFINQDQMLFNKNDINGLFINHETGIPTLTTRFNQLSADTDNLIEWEMIGLYENTQEEMNEVLNGCNYTVIQLSSASILEPTLQALVENGCTEDDHIIGTFDTSPLVYDAINAGSLKFAISQQPQLQGNMAMLMSSLYATVGQQLVADPNGGFFNALSNPFVITGENIPQYNPRNERNKFNLDPKDLSNINIKVVTHDIYDDNLGILYMQD